METGIFILLIVGVVFVIIWGVLSSLKDNDEDYDYDDDYDDEDTSYTASEKSISGNRIYKCRMSDKEESYFNGLSELEQKDYLKTKATRTLGDKSKFIPRTFSREWILVGKYVEYMKAKAKDYTEREAINLVFDRLEGAYGTEVGLGEQAIGAGSVVGGFLLFKFGLPAIVPFLAVLVYATMPDEDLGPFFNLFNGRGDFVMGMAILLVLMALAVFGVIAIIWCMFNNSTDEMELRNKEYNAHIAAERVLKQEVERLTEELNSSGKTNTHYEGLLKKACDGLEECGRRMDQKDRTINAKDRKIVELTSKISKLELELSKK